MFPGLDWESKNILRVEIERAKREEMLLQRETRAATAAAVVLLLYAAGCLGREWAGSVESKPQRILLDTDVDTDDFFALLYLLKRNRSEFQLEVRPYNICYSGSSSLLSHFLPSRLLCFRFHPKDSELFYFWPLKPISSSRTLE